MTGFFLLLLFQGCEKDRLVELPSLGYFSVEDITANSAVIIGSLECDGGAEITDVGVVWGLSQDPGLENHVGKVSADIDEDSLRLKITELIAETIYYIRGYATNSKGTDYSNQVSFITAQDDWPIDTETEVVEVFNPATGQTWMDRNLGASRAATSSTDEEAYGDLYQWGRAADGHQSRKSGETTFLSFSDTPGHDEFIISPDNPYDWRKPQNNDLWQGKNGVNNPCPDGFRLPTRAELEAELQSWKSNDAAGAIASPLKLPLTGSRCRETGVVFLEGLHAYLWTASVDGIYSWVLGFGNFAANMYVSARTDGAAVRCIKD